MRLNPIKPTRRLFCAPSLLNPVPSVCVVCVGGGVQVCFCAGAASCGICCSDHKGPLGVFLGSRSSHIPDGNIQMGALAFSGAVTRLHRFSRQCRLPQTQCSWNAGASEGCQRLHLASSTRVSGNSVRSYCHCN